MSFEFKPDETVPPGVQRILDEQIEEALKALTQSAKPPADEAVHDTRKRFKKIRAVLRLVRFEIGPREYRQENYCFRDAARPLSQMRDARVLVEKLDELSEYFADEMSASKVSSLRRALLAEQREVRQRVLKNEQTMVSIASEVGAARERIARWRFEHEGWAALNDGLRRVYRDGRRALRLAFREPTNENLHEWRKQVKYLWHQLQLLEPMWPEVMKELVDQVHQLADDLGDDHDYAVLRQTLLEDAERFPDRAAVDKLLPLLARRRAELQEAAWKLGERIYLEKPARFVKHLKSTWEIWRGESHDDAASVEEKAS